MVAALVDIIGYFYALGLELLQCHQKPPPPALRKCDPGSDDRHWKSRKSWFEVKRAPYASVYSCTVPGISVYGSGYRSSSMIVRFFRCQRCLYLPDACTGAVHSKQLRTHEWCRGCRHVRASSALLVVLSTLFPIVQP